MLRTDENLRTAFSEECQTYCRYLIFASKAEEEGLPEVAKLFRAAAEAEFIHLRNHLSVMGGMSTTKDNLLAATTGEHYAITRIYPGFIEQAENDRDERAGRTFRYAYEAEQTHNDLFEKAFKLDKSGQKIANESYLVCRLCGNLVTGEAPAKCPVCTSPAQQYQHID